MLMLYSTLKTCRTTRTRKESVGTTRLILSRKQEHSVLFQDKRQEKKEREKEGKGEGRGRNEQRTQCMKRAKRIELLGSLRTRQRRARKSIRTHSSVKSYSSHASCFE